MGNGVTKSRKPLAEAQTDWTDDPSVGAVYAAVSDRLRDSGEVRVWVQDELYSKLRSFAAFASVGLLLLGFIGFNSINALAESTAEGAAREETAKLTTEPLERMQAEANRLETRVRELMAELERNRSSIHRQSFEILGQVSSQLDERVSGARDRIQDTVARATETVNEKVDEALDATTEGIKGMQDQAAAQTIRLQDEGKRQRESVADALMELQEDVERRKQATELALRDVEQRATQRLLAARGDALEAIARERRKQPREGEREGLPSELIGLIDPDASADERMDALLAAMIGDSSLDQVFELYMGRDVARAVPLAQEALERGEHDVAYQASIPVLTAPWAFSSDARVQIATVVTDPAVGVYDRLGYAREVLCSAARVDDRDAFQVAETSLAENFLAIGEPTALERLARWRMLADRQSEFSLDVQDEEIDSLTVRGVGNLLILAKRTDMDPERIGRIESALLERMEADAEVINYPGDYMSLAPLLVSALTAAPAREPERIDVQLRRVEHHTLRRGPEGVGLTGDPFELGAMIDEFRAAHGIPAD